MPRRCLAQHRADFQAALATNNNPVAATAVDRRGCLKSAEFAGVAVGNQVFQRIHILPVYSSPKKPRMYSSYWRLVVLAAQVEA